MIIVKLIGGLGNQMFQYSVGRYLSEIHNTELKLDISGFEKYRLRSYGLGVFQARQSFATRKEVRTCIGFGRRLTEKIRARLGLALQSYGPRGYVQELEPGFDPKILTLSDDVYLEGFWQSEMYFSAIASIIRKEFTMKTPQRDKNLEIVNAMQACESVSVHVRRGDYLADPQTNKVHGVCDLDYYYRCVLAVAERAKNPYFFIFSDDPTWARENFKSPYPTTFVDHNGPEEAHEDLRLMSQSRHHIIANSSFSWWGAWLNANPNKIVFAPAQWFAMDKLQGKTDDIIPAAWNRL